ncbi:MAG: isoleucine--tRNA ligase [Deltaproteobacteria bacterium HGW-Deltaproteobacteria-15]|jgi:isoleucyl-tRNA synthetase|nr:MAG: isoleucine--tRNA ligase [Deltaproteobacteria bacterium HGW-Deltaproteobacteria-15]
MDTEADLMDYKDTLNLPRTDFPMKANLVKKEPEMIAGWEKDKLYQRIRESSKGRKRYTLHDGPPYANGNIHMGTAFNKILKDIIIKSKQMSGFDAPYVPGWDCHGLPIEHKVDQELGGRKKSMSQVEVRKYCRKYAEKFVDIQRNEFKRLGVFGEWDRPYLTMSYDYEATIVREFGKFALNGSLYKSKKPIYWCISCKTALAEAEVEYEQHTSPSIFVKFPMVSDISKDHPELRDKQVYILIWTTTPWTIPANLAVALHPDLEYVAVDPGNNEIWILAKGLVHVCMDVFGIRDYRIVREFEASELERLKAKHPLYERESLIVLAPYVTLEAGTGCVHTAPGHGREDYETGLAYGLDVYSPVDDSGRFTEDVLFFAGQEVFQANASVNKKLSEKGLLLKEQAISHEYPHCWRCKKPVIFRSTEQWFISMEKTSLRQNALRAIQEVSWIPRWGQDRIYGLIENRPDWCISRQRSWGVPITIFYCEKCNRILSSPEIFDHVVRLVEKSGADVWFAEPEEKLLPPGTTCPDCGSARFRKETDILDVWFDSGVSYAAVMEARDYLESPSDLYLEGSDQHRGWFHSSLLCSVGTRGRAPYKNVLTHGFVVDGTGKAMHKSAGNVVAPEDLIKKYGAEIIRLWVAAEDYRDNIRLSEEILQRLTEAYRRIRNTCRFLLGNLYDFDPSQDGVRYEEMEELDRWALHKLQDLSERVLMAYEGFEFHAIYQALHNFCVLDLSSFYLDVLKDRLYVSPPKSRSRRSAQTAMREILEVLVRLMAPILSFTADEIWTHMRKDQGKSNVHTDLFVPVKQEFRDPPLSERWESILKVRKEVTKALETARKERKIGHSLDASLTIGLPPEQMQFFQPYREMLKYLFIVSSVDMKPAEEVPGGVESEEMAGVRIQVESSREPKCERCWVHDASAGQEAEPPGLCARCREALKE